MSVVRPRIGRELDREAAAAWARRARSKQCVLCGAHNPQGHHLITQQRLRLSAAELELDFQKLRWDTRNFLPLCPRHHAGHHSKMHPISLNIVLAESPKVIQLARELDLVWWLSREYPIGRRKHR